MIAPEALIHSLLRGETQLERALAASILTLNGVDVGSMKIVDVVEPPPDSPPSGEPVVGAADQWTIQTIEDVDWALSRIADLERQKKENAAIVEHRISVLKVRLETLNERLDTSQRYFREKVLTWAMNNRKALLGTGKKKSRDLPHGRIAWRTRPARLEVIEAEKLLAWARDQPMETGVLRITEAPAMTEIQKHFRTTGEVPPGTDVRPESEELSVEPTEGMADVEEG